MAGAGSEVSGWLLETTWLRPWSGSGVKQVQVDLLHWWGSREGRGIGAANAGWRFGGGAHTAVLCLVGSL